MLVWNWRKILAIVILLLTIIVGYIGIGIWSTSLILSRKNTKIYAGLNISLESKDGLRLYAKERKQEDKEIHKWVILVHSYGADHTMMTPLANMYYDHGYNTLSTDNRAHGASEGKYIGMGYLDQEDVLVWINYIVELDAEAEIILHGISMGAACVMLVSAHPDLPQNVKIIIEDSGYKSANSYLSWKLGHKYHLPSIFILPIVNRISECLAGYQLTDVDAMAAVAKSKIPILFIHGAKDETVPVDDAIKLYNVACCKKDLLIVEDAGHGESVIVAEDVYWKKIFQWIS